MQLEHGPKAGAWAPAFFTDHEHGREHECAHIGTRLVQNARFHLSHEWVAKSHEWVKKQQQVQV